MRKEFPLESFAKHASKDALALVWQDAVWSQLVLSAHADRELFGVFGIHFALGRDNSGFAGWLATHLKQELGTGLVVTCRRNSWRGDIFDYRGGPAELKDDVLAELHTLRGG